MRKFFQNCEKMRTKSENCENPNSQKFLDKLWIFQFSEIITCLTAVYTVKKYVTLKLSPKKHKKDP
jgi:hypothetical protein